MLSLKVIADKNSSTGYGIPHFKTSVTEVLDFPKNNDIALGWFPEIKDKTLLLKMPHASDTVLGVIKLEFMWKSPP